MTILKRWEQQPADRIDRAFDYANGQPQPFLEGDDTLFSATVVAEPSGLNIGGVICVDGQVRYWVSGGVHGEKYKITCTATTRHGRIKQDEVILSIKEY